MLNKNTNEYDKLSHIRRFNHTNSNWNAEIITYLHIQDHITWLTLHNTHRIKPAAEQKLDVALRKNKKKRHKYTIPRSLGQYYSIPFEASVRHRACEQKLQERCNAANGSEIIRSHNKIKKCPRNKRKASEIRRRGLRSDAVWARAHCLPNTCSDSKWTWQCCQ